MNALILGAGAQGCAVAFDLCRRSEISSVTLTDVDIDPLPAFLDPFRGERLSVRTLDARDEDALADAMEGMAVVASALPHQFNLTAARLAVQAGAHFCDLGGETAIVEEQRELDEAAREAGVSVIPDCGLAPGLVNVLAQAGIHALDETEAVRIWVGGIPRHPKPPLNYGVVFSLEGVLNNYTTDALVLEEGELKRVPALSGVETLEFPEPAGELEGFYTGGGISTLPLRYEGRIRTMSYKTLRYPGHADVMRAIRDLGLLDAEAVEVRTAGGEESESGSPETARIVPRDVFVELVGPRLRDPSQKDLVAARVSVQGTKDGMEKTIRWDLMDHYDDELGMTAMMRVTGFSLAITALMQLDGRIDATGVRTPDECVPVDPYLGALAERGVHVERTDY
ncbi:MAG: saccharopine dehydrogenase C-terminal domain-containing protein [Longimicrobiales bacterium]|nr:saccharopine dehydrogenase C-terminal domain-containing protein [Longimicrobiales bacterium]